MTARAHLALLALAIVVLVAGGLVAFLLWRPQTHHSIQVNRQAQVQVPPRARRLVPEVSEKDKSRLAAAAGRVPLGTVMHWYGQQRFTDGNAPGTMSLPSECLKEAQADPKLAKWLENWQTNLHNRAPPSAQRSATPGAQRSDAPDSSSPGSSTPDSVTPTSSLSDHSSEAQDDSADSDSQLSQHAPQRNSTTPQQLKELEQILQASSLKALPLLDIGRAVDFFSDDEAATSRFYAAAGLRGAKEAPATNSGLAYRQMLLGLNSTRPLMWRVIDAGDRQPIFALKVICDLVSQCHDTHGVLGHDYIYAAIDAAECLYLEGKYNDASKALDAIYQCDLTEGQQLAANWASGITLFAAKRYSAALPFLKSVVGNGSKHAAVAPKMLIVSLAKVGDADGANDALDDWIRRSSPDVKQVAEIMGEIKKIMAQPNPVVQK